MATMVTMVTEVRDREFADIRSDLKMLKAMNGVAIAGIVAVLLRLFIH